MDRIPREEIELIRKLRRSGHSLPEIKRAVDRGAATVVRYTRGIKVRQEFAERLRLRQNTSRARSQNAWAVAVGQANQLVGNLTERDKIFLLVGLYWGEGTKRELNIINGDAALLGVFLQCLYTLGLKKEDLLINLRVFEDVNRRKAIQYWSQKLDVPPQTIHISEISKGKRGGKFMYGMCRIRVRRGGAFFKLIMSMIQSIKSEMSPRSSTD